MSDFTITAGDTAATLDLPTSGSVSVEIELTVGEVGGPETVTLSLDASFMQPGVTCSLSDTSVTTPATVTLTITATADASLEEGDLEVNATDGTNNHSVEIFPIIAQIPGAGRQYDTLPTAPTLAGGSLIQNPGASIGAIALCVHAGQLYVAWSEYTTSPQALFGPYLAVWAGSGWEIVASTSEPTAILPTLEQGSPIANMKLASDGTNLYLAYLAQYDTTQTVRDIVSPFHRTVTMQAFWVRVHRYSGGGLTDLGWFGAGLQGTGTPAGMNILGASGPTTTPLALSNNEGVSGGTILMDLAASPDEVGACYVAFYEDGYAGQSANQGGGYRRLFIVGFDGAAVGVVDLSSNLWQPTNSFDGSFSGMWWDPSPTPPYGYQFVIAGSGGTLALYGMDFSAPPGGLSTVMNIWSYGLSSLALAAAFPAPLGDSTVYDGFVVVSDDRAGLRLVGAAATVTDPIAGFEGTFILRPFATSAPTVPVGDVWDRVQLDKVANLGYGHRLFQEETNVWYGPGQDVADEGGFDQLTTRCGVTSWGNAFDAAAFAGGDEGVLFESAFWAPSGTGVYRMPICRGCGTCPGGARIWQRI